MMAKVSVIQLADEHYARLVIEVAEPSSTVELIEQALSRPVPDREDTGMS
jgi:hypothetical protein